MKQTKKGIKREVSVCLYVFRDLLNLTEADFSCLEKGMLWWEKMHCSLQCSYRMGKYNEACLPLV